MHRAACSREYAGWQASQHQQRFAYHSRLLHYYCAAVGAGGTALGQTGTREARGGGRTGDTRRLMVKLPVLAQGILLQRRNGLKLKAGYQVDSQRLRSGR